MSAEEDICAEDGVNGRGLEKFALRKPSRETLLG
jgi:hypothetical protein